MPKVEPRTECAGCGMCCRTIHLHGQVEEFIKDAMKGDKSTRYRLFGYTGDTRSDHDIAFIMANFYPLSREEVMSRNPHIASWRKLFEEHGRDFDHELDNNFYGCVQLDEETGLCRVHDNQPRTCSGYPFYDGPQNAQPVWYAEDCYYQREVEQNEKDINNAVDILAGSGTDD